MSRTAPKLVIFDCDGVLVDTEGPANRLLVRLLNDAGLAITYEEARKTLCGRSMASVQAEVAKAGVELGDGFVDDWYRELPKLFEQGVNAIPHVDAFVRSVKTAGLPYCVASSGRVEKMRLTLGKSGLLAHFEDVLFSASMVERGKPFPDLFLHAADMMGHAPQDCVVIEDSVPGVEAAAAAGMTAYGYCGDPYTNRDGLSAAGGILFDDMRDLPALMGLVAA